MPELDINTRGEKTDVHILLYDHELAILDSIRKKFSCSRGAAVGGLLRAYDEDAGKGALNLGRGDKTRKRRTKKWPEPK